VSGGSNVINGIPQEMQNRRTVRKSLKIRELLMRISITDRGKHYTRALGSNVRLTWNHGGVSIKRHVHKPL
jgi:hypothetical protein